MAELVTGHGDHAAPGWWDQVQPYSLGWVTARLQDGVLVGFVNVAWDGGDHAFLLDTKVAGGHQRQGIATALVATRLSTPRRPAASGFTWISKSISRRSTSTPAASGPLLPG